MGSAYNHSESTAADRNYITDYGTDRNQAMKTTTTMMMKKKKQKAAMAMGPLQRCISALNLLTMLLSIPVVASGLWLASKQQADSSDCTRFLRSPVLALGLLILSLSMLGFLAASCSLRRLLWLYLLLLFLLILSLLAFTTFALAVTSNVAGSGSRSRYVDQDSRNGQDSGNGEDSGNGQDSRNGQDSDNGQDSGLMHGSFSSSSSSGFAHLYELSYYSGWLTRHVQEPHVWRHVHSCLADANVCAVDAIQRPAFLPEALFKHLNTLQVGCCKPPAVCEFNMVNEKGGSWEWEDPRNMTASEDCTRWANEASQLCYDCNTCKAGLLANLRRDWSKVALLNIVVLAFLLVVYALALCLFQQSAVSPHANTNLVCHHAFFHDFIPTFVRFLCRPFHKSYYNRHGSSDCITELDYCHNLHNHELYGGGVTSRTINNIGSTNTPPAPSFVLIA